MCKSLCGLVGWCSRQSLASILRFLLIFVQMKAMVAEFSFKSLPVQEKTVATRLVLVTNSLHCTRHHMTLKFNTSTCLGFPVELRIHAEPAFEYLSYHSFHNHVRVYVLWMIVPGLLVA